MLLWPSSFLFKSIVYRAKHTMNYSWGMVTSVPLCNIKSYMQRWHNAQNVLLTDIIFQIYTVFLIILQQ